MLRTSFLSTLSLRRATPDFRRYIGSDVPFLSTLSLRRATCYSLRHSAQMRHFYPRSPCGERLVASVLAAGGSRYFYPRSPCGERRIGLVFLWWGVRFLSTLSLRRATVDFRLFASSGVISIHALLAESDPRLMYFWPCGLLFLSTLSLRRATAKKRWLKTNLLYFYPRSPCGERLRKVPILGIK